MTPLAQRYYDNLISLLNKEIEDEPLRELAILYVDDIIDELEVYNTAIKCIKNRMLYDIEQNKNVFVNKLIYWEDELMINGINPYKVKDYKKTWYLPKIEKDKIIGTNLTEEQKKELMEVLDNATCKETGEKR